MKETSKTISKKKTRIIVITISSIGFLINFLFIYYWWYPIIKTWVRDTIVCDTTYVYDFSNTTWLYDNKKQGYQIRITFDEDDYGYASKVTDGKYVLIYKEKEYAMEINESAGHGMPLVPVAPTHMICLSTDTNDDCPIEINLAVMLFEIDEDLDTLIFNDLYIDYLHDVKGSGLTEKSKIEFNLVSGTVTLDKSFEEGE